jgi:hypothetical protein
MKSEKENVIILIVACVVGERRCGRNRFSQF